MNLKALLPQIISATLASSFNLQLGLALGYSAILIPQIESENSDVHVSKEESSWLASIMVIMATVAALFSGICMEYLGRLNTIKLASIPCAIGWILLSVSTNFRMLLFGRILTGLACGLGASPAVVYITEIAPPDIRGSLNSLIPTLTALGMLLVYVEGALVNWKWVALINLISNVLAPIFIQLFVPESPIWLIHKGRNECAVKSLKVLYKNYEPSKENQNVPIHEEQFKILLERDEEQRKAREHLTGVWKEFLQPTGYKPILILIFLFVIQQFSGIYITMVYAVTFIEESGTNINPYHASILIGAIRFIMSCFNLYLLKKFCRRPLIMISCLGMAIFMIISGLFTMWLKEGKSEMYWVPVACLLFYVFSSLIGLMTIPWTMSAEMFPTKIRGIGHSISFAVGSFMIFAAVHSYRYGMFEMTKGARYMEG